MNEIYLHLCGLANDETKVPHCIHARPGPIHPYQNVFTHLAVPPTGAFAQTEMSSSLLWSRFLSIPLRKPQVDFLRSH